MKYPSLINIIAKNLFNSVGSNPVGCNGPSIDVWYTQQLVIQSKSSGA